MKKLLLCIGFFCHAAAGAVAVQLPAYVKERLASGDIIIRKGGGALSYQLMQISKENYSHCGIVVKDQNEWKVIQSIAGPEGTVDGVQLTPIADFVKYTADSALFICRPILDTLKNEELAARAFHYLALKIPFDHRFDLLNEERFYCSELLIHIFKDVFGQPVFEIRKQHKTYVPLFSTCFDNTKFRAIFNLGDRGR